jgi:4-hydroxybenzoate polyprenyltransferase
MQNIVKRATRKTPKFFRKIRNWGIAFGAIGTAIVTALVSLPAGLVTLGTYLIVGGSVATAVYQLTTQKDDLEKTNSDTEGE